MIAPQNYALLIGVEDYSVFDESLGQPAGTSHLPGGRADALSLFKICRDLGIPVENLRICTSPRLDPSQIGDIPPECLSDATSTSIREGLAWLAGRLGAESLPAGLLLYSGHGDWLEGRGLVLCPSDTSGPNLTNALPFSEIEALFQQQQAAANLTVVLDTCHAGTATDRAGRRAGSLTGRSLPAALADVIPSLGDRVLAACGPADLAWRGRFSGLHRGAFSWAVASTLEQWAPRMDGRNVELDLSYEDLLDRTSRLLSSLGFSQSPQLLGKVGTGRLPFFHGTKKQNPGVILQVDPDYKVGITFSWYTSLPWTVVSVGGYSPSGSGYNLFTEYWALDSTFISQLGRAVPGGTLTMTPQSYTSPWPTAPLTNPTISLWSPSAPPSGAKFWYSNVTTSTHIGLSFNLTAGTPWTGTITWYVAAPTGSTPPPSIVGSTVTTFTYTSSTPALPSGYSWFTMRLPALVWSSAPTVADSSSAVLGTAVATAGIVVCLAYIQSAGGTVRSRTSTNGTTWGSSLGAIATGAQGSPGLAALGSTFHLAYNASGTLQHRTSTDGMNWTGTGTITTSSGSPSLATVVSTSSTLCAAYQSGSNPSQIHTRAWNGTSWSSPSTATSSATGAGSLAALGSSLYLAVPTSSGFSIFRATSVSTSGISWPGSATATITPPGGSTWTGPGLSAWQGQLVLTFKDQAGHVWACFSPDGVSWSGYQDLTVQIPAVATNAPMSAGALGTRLILAFNKTTAATGLATLATT